MQMIDTSWFVVSLSLGYIVVIRWYRCH